MAVILDLTTHQPPSVISPGPTGMRSGHWKFTWTSTAASITYDGYVDLLIFGYFYGGIELLSFGGSNDIYLFVSDQNDRLLTTSISFSAGQPVTFEFDTVSKTLVISGATTGNGTFALVAATTGTISWGPDTEDLFVGRSHQYDPDGAKVFVGTFSNVEDFSGGGAVTGTAAGARPGLTGAGVGTHLAPTTGTAAGVRPGLSAVAVGTHYPPITGTAAGVRPGLTGTASGIVSGGPPATAISFRAATGNKSVFNTTVTFDSTGAEEGDLLLFFLVAAGTYVENSAPGGIVPPSGAYTQILTTTNSGGADGIFGWSKIVGISEPTSHVFTLASSVISYWVCISYNPEAAASITVGDISINTGVGDTWSATAIDVVNSDARLLTLIWGEAPSGGDGQTVRIEQVGDFTNHVLKLADDVPGVGDSGTRLGTCTLQNFIAVNIAIEGDAGGEEEETPEWPPQVNAWKNISPPDVFGNGDYVTQSMAFAPSDPNVVFLSVIHTGQGQPFCGLWKSTSGGQPGTWSHITAPGQGKPETVIDIVIDPADASNVWVACGVRGENHGMWHSTDGGATWVQPAGWTSVTPNSDLYDIAFDPSDFDHMLISYHSPWGGIYGASSGILRTTDGGVTWSIIAPGAWTDGGGCGVDFLYSLEHGLGHSGRWLWGSQSAGRWLTNNYGATWTQVSTVNMAHGGQQLAYLSDGSVVLTGAEAIDRSTDNGATWSSIGPGAAPHLGLAARGDTVYTLRQNAGTPVKQAKADAPSTWSNLTSLAFPSINGGGGTFQMHYSPANQRLYNASIENGLWVFQFEQEIIDGSGTATRPGLTGVGVGALSMSGTAAGVRPGLTGAGVGANSSTISGAAAGVRPGLTGAGVGTLSISGAAAGIRPGLTGTGVGTLSMSGTAAGVRPGLTGTGVGTLSMSGTAAGVRPGLTGTGVGTLSMSGTSAGLVAGLIGNSTGSSPGSAAGLLSGLTGSSLGVLAIPGVAAQSLSGLVGASSGALTVSGTAAAVLSGVSGFGSSTSIVIGSAAGGLAGVVGAGLGSISIVGSVACARPSLTGSASGSIAIVGSGTPNLPPLIGLGLSSSIVLGVVSGVCSGLSASTSGNITLSGSAATSLTGPVGQATGSIGINGTLAGVIPGLVGQVLPPALPVTGAAAAALQRLQVVAVGASSVTRVVFALDQLYERVQARFLAELAPNRKACPMPFGWRTSKQQISTGQRIVWYPGDPSGALGETLAPKYPGRVDPGRPLATLGELFTVEITSADTTANEDERLQYQACRLLYDAWYRACYLAAHGTFKVRSSSWVNTKLERRYGATIRAVCSIEAMIPDSPFTGVLTGAEADVVVHELDYSTNMHVVGGE